MKVFFSVGEPSGDLHGANLIQELRKRDPAVQCVGYGGPRMAAAGCQLHADLTQFAVMWLSRVLLNLHHFWKLYRQAGRYFAEQRPDAVVLIDYPGFNWWIARAAKRESIPVFYYGVPQMWGWAGWRVKKMRRLVDHVLCKLPFEADWFRQRGCHAVYVGHPYFDEVLQRSLDERFIEEQRGKTPLVTILPGSRTQEVTHNLPVFLRTARAIRGEYSQVRFAIAAFNDRQAKFARELVQQSGLEIPVYCDRTPELIEAAHCCLACSGSVSLELLAHEKPTVIHYHIGRFLDWVQGLLKQVPYITLVNLLATDRLFSGRDLRREPFPPPEQALFPEYLTSEDRSREMARNILTWLTDESAHAATVRRLTTLKSEIVRPGASAAAAELILSLFPPAAPHCHVRDAA